MNIVGIDLGGTRIKIGIVSETGLQGCKITDTVPGTPIQRYLDVIESQVIALKDELHIKELYGIALAFPGLVDTENNRIIGTNHKYDDARAVNLTDWAKKTFGLALEIENDARLSCLGEWKYGAGKGTDNMVMCTLGTGVGSSAIINGQILRGKHFQAGVLGGHSVIDFQSSHQCTCGGFGCVESTASTWRIRGLAENHPLFPKSLLYDKENIDIALIFELSKNGDQLSQVLKEHCINAWAAGLINLIHAYDPEVLVLGGGILNSGDMLIPEFQRIISAKAWCPSGIPEIRLAAYPDTAALLGAMTLFDTIPHETIFN